MNKYTIKSITNNNTCRIFMSFEIVNTQCIHKVCLCVSIYFALSLCHFVSLYRTLCMCDFVVRLCLPDALNKSSHWVPDHGMDCVWDKMCVAPIVILFVVNTTWFITNLAGYFFIALCVWVFDVFFLDSNVGGLIEFDVIFVCV